MNIDMETELRWLKAVEKERLYKNSYPWVLSKEKTINENFFNSDNRSFNNSEVSSLLGFEGVNVKNNSVLQKNNENDLTLKMNVTTQTENFSDLKSPSFNEFHNQFKNSDNESKVSQKSQFSKNFKNSSPIGRDKNIYASERSLKHSALSVNSIQNSESISKSSLRYKSHIMQAVYNLLDNLEKSEGNSEELLVNYSGKARKVCEVVLEHINQEIKFQDDFEPLSKVELSKIQEVHSDSSLETKGITAMLGDVLKEIKQVKEEVSSLSNSKSYE